MIHGAPAFSYPGFYTLWGCEKISLRVANEPRALGKWCIGPVVVGPGSFQISRQHRNDFGGIPFPTASEGPHLMPP